MQRHSRDERPLLPLIGQRWENPGMGSGDSSPRPVAFIFSVGRPRVSARSCPRCPVGPSWSGGQQAAPVFRVGGGQAEPATGSPSPSSLLAACPTARPQAGTAEPTGGCSGTTESGSLSGKELAAESDRRLTCSAARQGMEKPYLTCGLSSSEYRTSSLSWRS